MIPYGVLILFLWTVDEVDMGSLQNAIGLWLCRYVFIYTLPTLVYCELSVLLEYHRDLVAASS
jgi:hypothetical protein